jgi:hypothetical protein
MDVPAHALNGADGVSEVIGEAGRVVLPEAATPIEREGYLDDQTPLRHYQWRCEITEFISKSFQQAVKMQAFGQSLSKPFMT